jgi:nitrate/nitrite transport system ATP-binding protein
MSFLELKQVSKGFGEGKSRIPVLDRIDLSVEEGEFIVILGFSGTGKTTLISLIAGLLKPDGGEILLKEKNILGPGPDRGVVFQNYALLPWLTVYDNVGLAVNHLFREWPAEKRKAHIEKYIEMVNLTPAKFKKPAELSGGMKQRVSVARALAMNPEILLLDEPLSALDALTRGSLQTEIAKIWSRDKKTVVLITNDIDEAILLADRILPLKPGENGATLGPAFEVSLPRPRDKSYFNTDPSYRKLRNEVSRYFLDLQALKNLEQSLENIQLPDLKPVQLEATL